MFEDARLEVTCSDLKKLELREAEEQKSDSGVPCIDRLREELSCAVRNLLHFIF